MDGLGLYLHIPFCKSKCAYCDFLSSSDKNLENEYVDKLVEEVTFYAERLANKYQVDTIFIGGGTPSVLSSGKLSQIVDAIYKNFSLSCDPEITIECNPESINGEKIGELTEICNRVSLGVQSTCDDTLRIIGRAHDRRKAFDALDLLTKTDLSISADLILGLPGENVDTVEKSVVEILDYGVPHLSAYGLSLEKGTRLYRSVQNGECKILDGDGVADCYDRVLEIANSFGLERYEVSNFAKRGYECKHNIGYWTRKSYLGMGIGAHSLLQNARFYNTRNIKAYLSVTDFNAIKEKEAVLSKDDELEETVMLGLRLRDGINPKKIYDEFGVDVFEKFSKGIKSLNRVLEVSQDKICVKKEYFYSLNSIIVEFLD